MGRFKKGQRQRTTDMWEKAGGREAIVGSFMHHHVSEVNVPAHVWTSVTLHVFKTTKKEYTNWLKIIWRKDRRGVQTAVLHADETQKQEKKSHGEGQKDTKKDEEEADVIPAAVESDSSVDDESAKTLKISPRQTQQQEKKSHGEGQKDTKKDEEEAGVIPAAVESDSSVDDESAKTLKISPRQTQQQEKKSHGEGQKDTKKDEEEAGVIPAAVESDSSVDDESAKTLKISPRQTQQQAKKSHGEGQKDTKKDEEEADMIPAAVESDSSVDDESAKTLKISLRQTQQQAKKSHGEGQKDTKKDEEEADVIPAAVESDSSVDDESAQEEEIDNRHCKPGRRQFKISITKKKWDKIKPKHDKNKLRSPWTDTLYHEFLKENPCCTLTFKYQHVKKSHSHKKKCHYFSAKAKCTFDECAAVYLFSKRNKPKSTDTKIKFQVTRVGEVTHRKNQRRFRPAKYLRRGKIAKAITQGVSNFHYAALRNTPLDETTAGNITRSMTKDVLKKISSEVKKSSRLHNDVMLELMLTQKVIRESSSHASFKGYLQHLQIDPFALHLYTEGGLNILTEHLKKSSPVTLYLDATGSVVQKIAEQKKKVLYYALVLPGMGKDSPPLPVTELVSNSHSVPAIAHWLLEFTRKMSHKTKKQIAQVETDHSWALINSALIAFNKENVSVYLDRAFKIAMGQTEDIQPFTVLHLCSAHILKAVLQALAKRTTDKGIREYALYTFAYLLNCNTIKMAVEVFYHMCVLFDAEEDTEVLTQSKQYLDVCIRERKGLKVEESEETMEDVQTTTDKTTNTIIGKSPFTKVFKLQREQASCDTLSDDAVGTKNQYHCPGVIDVLLQSYMGIFPLWAGLLLGDLSRHRRTDEVNDKTPKTRETNCHVELWFGLVKHSILQKKVHLRPAEFVSKMYASMQGRYIEHIMQNDLPEHILNKLHTRTGKSVDDPVECWNKRESSAGRNKSRSKYFNPPKTITKAKRKIKPETVKPDHRDNDAQLTLLWKKRDTEVVVAVIPSQMKGQNLLIHHSELCSLRPHQWLTGEVIEGLLHVFGHTFGVMDTIYLMSHYTAGCILFGDRDKLRQQSLRKVNFSNFGAVLSFVLVNNNHWNLLYIHAETRKVYLVDPAQKKSELMASQAAAKRIREYFLMRRSHGKPEWADVTWKGGVISHPIQVDGSSCGVIVAKMAKVLMENFPAIPPLDFMTSRKEMEKERRDLALTLLEASVFDEQNFCAMCATFKPPGPGTSMIQWIQCDGCDRWFHSACLSMENEDIEEMKDKTWKCPICK